MSPLTGLPGWLVRIAARLAGPERRDDVVGDLEESWLRVRRRRGRIAAGLRLGRELSGLALWRLGGLIPRGARAGADLARDGRVAVRSLARRPVFTLAAVTVLGIGIGAPTTVLSLVNRIFFQRPAHVEQPDRLVRLYRSWTSGQVGGSLGHPDVVYFREGADLLEGLVAWSGSEVVAWSTEDGAGDQAALRFVSPDYFDVLGVPLLVGRAFREPEGRVPGADAVAVVTEGFWRRVLGGVPEAVGRTVRLNGVPVTVVGVTPDGFAGLSPLDEGAVELWVPIALYGAITRAPDTAWWERLPNARSNWLSVAGRLAPGVTFEAAEAQLTALRAALDYEGEPDDERLAVVRQVLYSPSTARSLLSLSRLLALAVGIVLLVAASNVTVLLLSRATTRTRELGIRTALGAGRGRLVRQLLAESLVLGAAGGALGVLLATVGSDLAGSFLPYRFAGGFEPDGRVLGVAVALSFGTAVLVGLVPALGATRRDVAGAMGDGRSAGGRSRLRDGLVVAQVALSVVLVSGAVLFARSFAAASGQTLGFATEDRLLLSVDLRGAGLEEDEARVFVADVLAGLRTLPGVRGVATTRQVPFGGDWSTDFVPDPTAFPDAPREPVFLGLNAVSPDYFEVMEVPLLAGRAISSADAPGAPLAAVINRTFADALWPGTPPQALVGRVAAADDDRAFTIVGVAENAQYYQLGEAPVAQAYLSVDQVWQGRITFVVHGADAGLAGAARAVVRSVRPDLAVAEVSSLEAVFEAVTARYRVSAALVGLFGAFTLVLAGVGLYGVVSFAVQTRTREIGVRMALGAPRRRVAGQVLGTSLARAGAGVAVGLVLAVWARRFAENLVFGVGTLDPWALAGGAAILLTVAALATAAPARRATRVDPLESMRVE